LNDISKDHPERVIELCLAWQKKALKEKPDKQKRLDWIIRHATRGLVKSGHPSSFSLLGYTKAPKLTIDNLKLNKKSLKIGEDIEFSFNIECLANKQKFVLDYALHYQKANGSTSPKVFKIKNLLMQKNETQKIKKAQSFKEITTRKFHPGKHAVAIHINGQEMDRVECQLMG
jgi:hypothetical protein